MVDRSQVVTQFVGLHFTPITEVVVYYAVSLSIEPASSVYVRS